MRARHLLATLLLPACCLSCYAAHTAPDTPDTSTPTRAPPPVSTSASATEVVLLEIERSADGEGLGSWRVYNEHGQLVRDLASLVTLPADEYPRVYLSVPKQGIERRRTNVIMIRDPDPRSRTPTLAAVHIRGQSLSTSSLNALVVADSVSAAATRLIGVSIHGDVPLDVELDSRWSHFELSPSGTYALGQDEGGHFDSRQVVIVDTATGAVTWEGALQYGAFRSDDSAFVFLSEWGDPYLTVQPLPEGAQERIAIPRDSGSYLLQEHATDHGMIFRNYGNVTFGTSLWLLKRDGRWLRLGGTFEQWSLDNMFGFMHDGRSAIFRRSETHGHETTAQLGVFTFDLASERFGFLRESLSWVTSERFYWTDETGVWMSDGRSAAERFGPPLETSELPTPAGFEHRWRLRPCTVSPNADILVVCANPTGPGTMPPDPDWYPADGLRLYDPHGRLIRALQAGTARFDKRGRVLRIQPFDPSLAGQIALFNVARNELHWIDSGASTGVFFYLPSDGL